MSFFDPTEMKKEIKHVNLTWLYVMDKSGETPPVSLNTLCGLRASLFPRNKIAE